MFSTNGDPVCKGCFYTVDALQRQLAGGRQMLLGGICSIVFGVLCLPFALVLKKLGALLAGTLIAGGIVGIRYGSQTLGRARDDLARGV
ncbi:MAG TPA: hypothetical protein VH054_12930 [Polyangiaceae bacterium]|jgi:uncharacterized membrane protein HdeD (DUF308 family)|nr:hypothetical protein [Polyangiaceae bacterium]